MQVRPGVVEEVEGFIAGEEPPTVPESVLATLLFTDIVGSTERAAELGDRDWRDLLARHNALVRRELARFGGEERDTAGDGFFATFDGPARRRELKGVPGTWQLYAAGGDASEAAPARGPLH